MVELETLSTIFSLGKWLVTGVLMDSVVGILHVGILPSEERPTLHLSLQLSRFFVVITLFLHSDRAKGGDPDALRVPSVLQVDDTGW